MKWIAKRILLKSKIHMEMTLIHVIDHFVFYLIHENYITGWYCSCKFESDGSKPSIRIYLNIVEEYENKILALLNDMLNRNKILIGWTRNYNTPDPKLPDANKTNLHMIQAGCEIALRLLKKYPDDQNRHFKTGFQVDLTNSIRSIKFMKDNREAIHFIANNLMVNDYLIWQLLSTIK